MSQDTYSDINLWMPFRARIMSADSPRTGTAERATHLHRANRCGIVEHSEEVVEITCHWLPASRFDLPAPTPR
jgi:hypothetical protein